MPMARQGKIEKYQLEALVHKLANQKEPLSRSDIAKECNRVLKEQGIDDKVSPMAVQRFLEALPAKQAEVVKTDMRMIKTTIRQNYNIIESQLRVSQKMYQQLDLLEDLPKLIQEQYERLMDVIEISEGPDIIYPIKEYFKAIKKSFAREVGILATINREVRENNKFLTQLQEKIYEFSIVQEFIKRFLEGFQAKAPEVFAVVIQDIAKDPYMQKLVEQQMMYQAKGDKE
jgi:hypothetical protein